MEFRVNNIKYHYNRLNDNEKTLYNIILNNLLEENYSFNVSLNENIDFSRVYNALSLDEPGLIYVDFTSEISVNNGSLSFQNLGINREDVEKIDEVIKQIRGKVTSLSEYEKALYIHDYLAQNVFYDYDAFDEFGYIVHRRSFNLVGALVDGQATCQGLSLAYTYLLSEFGVSSFTLETIVSNNTHIINCVKISDSHTNVDLSEDCKKNNLGFERKKKTYYPIFHHGFGLSDRDLIEFRYTSNEFYGCQSEEFNYLKNMNVEFKSWPEIRRYIYKQCNRKKMFIFKYEGKYEMSKMQTLIQTSVQNHGIKDTRCLTIKEKIYYIYGGDLYEY